MSHSRDYPAWLGPACGRVLLAVLASAIPLAGCTAATSNAHLTAGGSASSGCSRALAAVSRYGPTVVRDAVGVKKLQDTVELTLIIFALDGAADAVGDSAAKQSIRSLASAYATFRDRWTGAVAPSLETVLADTRHLDSVCES